MTQSNVILAFIALAFFIFITMRGELRTYMGFLFGSTAAPPQSASNNTDKAASYAATAAKFAAMFA